MGDCYRLDVLERARLYELPQQATASPESVPPAEGLRRRSPGQHALGAAVEVPRQRERCGKLDSSLTSSNTPARLPVIVVAGGQALVRAARRSVLSRAGLEVVADVADASRAAESCGAVRGRVGSRRLQTVGCVLAVRRIVERAPTSAVLIVAPELDHESLLAAVRAGARGFIPETHGAGSLIRAVEVALACESVIPRAGVNALIDEGGRGGPQEQTSVEGFPLQLTRREADVMKRRREGMTTKEIAYELDLSGVTVRRHRLRSPGKLRQARPLTLALESTS